MDDLERLALLIKQRNEIDSQIAALIGRPALPGHMGEYIAAAVFGIRMATAATNRASDGIFSDGPLAGRAVTITWYSKLEGVLDITPAVLPDDYLVVAGPRVTPASSRGTTRPALIQSVFLFDAADLIEHLSARGVKIGVATSVHRQLWDAAEIYPRPTNGRLVLSGQQRHLLALFQ
jgi:hypothetical protein